MGIYEIIILVAAAVVFIIIIRRFPETANGDEMKINWLKIPKLKFALPKISGIKMPQKVSSDDFSFNDQPKVLQRRESSEPGANLEDINIKFPKLVQPLEEEQKYFDMNQ
jgi:hypothetical protein